MNKVVYQDLGYSFLADIDEKQEESLLYGCQFSFNHQQIVLQNRIHHLEKIGENKITVYRIDMPGNSFIYLNDLWTVMTDAEFDKYIKNGKITVWAEDCNYINYVDKILGE